MIAIFYCGAIEINNHLLFSWLADRPFRYWIYLPAGLKLFLVMIFGLRAVYGVSLGVAISMVVSGLDISFLHSLLIGSGSGFAIFLSIYFFSYITKVAYPWYTLKFYQIPSLALLASILNSLIAYLIYRHIGLEDPFDWQSDIFIDVTGRFVGTFIFLFSAIYIRKFFSSQSKKTKITF